MIKSSITPQDALNQRWSALEKDRSDWVPHWKQCGEIFLPRSGRFFTSDVNSGRKKHNNIYDSTGTRALRVLGAGLMGGATSPARPWARLAIPDRDLMDYAPVKEWLHTSTRLMLDIFQKSNTYRSLHTTYEELGVYGTHPTILLDDFKKVIWHYPLTAGQYCLAIDNQAKVNTMYREFDWTVEQIVSEFGYSNCSTTVQNLYTNKSYDVRVTIVHAVEPRHDRDPRKQDAQNMAFKSCYYEKGQENNKFLRQSGMKKFRVLAPRWAVTAGDTYGWSPAMEALGDGRQLQHQQLRKAEAIDYQTKPPLQVPTSMKNKALNALPGGVSYVDSAGPNGGVKTLFEAPLRLDYLLADIQDVRERIKEAFYTDLFLMIAGTNDHRMTATEVAERQEEKLLMLGPVLERLHNELLEPLVDITFERMIEAGILPPPPPELEGQELQIEFISMLAQAQKAVSTNSIDRFVISLGQIATMKPEVLDKFNSDEWVDIYSDVLGVDPTLVVPDDKVAMVRKERAAAVQRQEQANAIQQGSETAKNLANAPTDGNNVLTNVIDQFSGYTTP